jgi:hypothetical protein
MKKALPPHFPYEQGPKPKTKIKSLHNRFEATQTQNLNSLPISPANTLSKFVEKKTPFRLDISQRVAY